MFCALQWWLDNHSEELLAEEAAKCYVWLATKCHPTIHPNYPTPLLPMTWRGRLIVPVAFAQALMVTLSLLIFLPSVDFSKEAASVLSGNNES